jgi:hypothetical protein
MQYLSTVCVTPQVLPKALDKGTHLCPTYPIYKNGKVKALRALESWLS